MRARFVVTPITSDEGGYLAVARAWRRGAVLYDEAWVDRPQGLLVLYRLLDAVGLGTPEGVRVMAILACMLAVVACADVAATLGGERARGLSALVVGVLASVPQYEGFIANAELLSCAVGAGALAVALRSVWDRGAPDPTGLLVAGALGGAALSIKQSAFDAVTAALVAAVLVGSSSAQWRRRKRVAAPFTFASGVAFPLAVLALHGLVTGWDRWWYAVVGYRSSQRSAVRNADWERLGRTWDIVAPIVAPALLGVVVAGIAVAVTVPYRQHLRAVAVIAVWWAAALAAFALGGQFHRHYWMILVFPLATTVGILIDALGPFAVRAAVAVAVVAAPIAATVRAVTIDRSEVGPALHGDGRLVHDESIAAWFSAHRRSGDSLWPMCASAGFFGNVTVDPPYPYLWFDGVLGVDGAQELLVSTLRGPSAPRFVAEYQRSAGCDLTGGVAAALRDRYRVVAVLDGVRIFGRSP